MEKPVFSLQQHKNESIEQRNSHGSNAKDTGQRWIICKARFLHIRAAVSQRAFSMQTSLTEHLHVLM